MSEAAQVRPMMTVEEYIAYADARPGQRFELLAGVPVAMVSGTLRHTLIAGNIDEALRRQLRGRGCSSLRDFGVTRSRDDDFLPQPDVIVRCGPVDDRRRWVSDPIVVIEVLSPSTMHHDRGYKLQTYFSFSTLRHVVLVYQDEMRVEHWSRSEGEPWGETPEVLKGPTDRLSLASVEAGLVLSEIYSDVNLA